MMKDWLKKWIWAAVICCMLAVNCRVALAAVEEERVLFISSYSPSFETFDCQVTGLREVLDKHGMHMDIEFMDTKRYNTSENISRFYELLRYKMEQGSNYQAVIVADDNALDFAVAHRDDIFKDLPVVFMGINDVDRAVQVHEDFGFTGTVERVSIKGTLDLMLPLFPRAERVVALTTDTPTARAVMEQYYAVRAYYPNLILTEIDLSYLTFEEFGLELEQLGDNDVLLSVEIVKDGAGSYLDFSEALHLIFEHSDLPLFSLYEFGVEDGMLGGHVVDISAQGRIAAQMAVRIMAGEDPSSIPIAENLTSNMINEQVLEGYGIDSKALPMNTVYVNREVSVLERYQDYFLIGLAVIILQLLMIVLDQRNINKRKRVEAALNERQASLLASNEELKAANTELKSALDEIREQRAKIHNLLFVDNLTGLMSKYAIMEKLTALLKYSDFSNQVAVMFLDIDNFKDINDSFGHAVGDKAITLVGERLRRIVTPKISIGRYGGDEFIIVVDGADQVSALDHLLRQIKAVFSEHAEIDEHHFFMTFSIGVALYPEHGQEVNDLIKKADVALYKSKVDGRNRTTFYNFRLGALADDKVSFRTQLREGFLNNEFYLRYQPYIETETKRILGFEALIRWDNPTAGKVPAAQLIRTAEEIGLIAEIGEWIFREACLFIKKINEVSDERLSMVINTSLLQLEQDDFYEYAVRTVEEFGLDPGQVTLGIYDTYLIRSSEIWRPSVMKLRDYGFVLALDNFGSGYSTLSHFRSMPARMINIDKTFIDDIEVNRYNEYIVTMIIELAYMNGVRVVAKGVETSAQYEMLKRLGCDAVQGFYFSRPLLEKDALDYIKINRAR